MVDLIQKHNSAKTHKSKRSIIRIIGTLARVIFEVTTENEEIKIRRAIEVTANDTRTLAALLANQIEIVAPQLNLTNHRIDKLQLTVAKLSDELNWSETTRAMDLAA